MDEKKLRITLTLSPGNPLHSAAWDVLRGVAAGKRTEYICKAVAEYNAMRYRSKQITRREIGEIVQRSVTDALSQLFDENDFSDRAFKQKNAVESTDDAGEVEQNFLGFLSSLQ